MRARGATPNPKGWRRFCCQELFDELTGLEYHEVKGGKYERVNSLTEKDIDERVVGARTRALVDRRHAKHGLGQSPQKGTREAPVPTQREEVTAATPEQSATEKPAYGADNKLVTQDRAEEIRKRLREKLNQLNVGIDPEMMSLGAELAVFHIEAGSRSFIKYAKAVIDDLGT